MRIVFSYELCAPVQFKLIPFSCFLQTAINVQCTTDVFLFIFFKKGMRCEGWCFAALILMLTLNY